ncbi:histidine kinase [Vibrio crassostreae]|uniref:ATP-binding protein n=1 Tax=Vibrio lentus TaxID=136468 RepID=UPI000C844732|nr:ATP-binding protein [Vibrio lentus]CAK1839902.1 histidine kinase [Vibrio crassostreae]PMK96881.1 hypothetical protein BCT89_10005 [Vibrio lentus]PML51287.1 hypothetical protein BCT75_11660 [Vibrio lentus]CAK1991318.1 histidine kinase [Vibrio crassostreae]CAK1996264.1 histidine kinase [Vibrio crassostreae]
MTEKFAFKSDSFAFDVDAQLIRELGERLVSRNHIGVSELIKNSYDADSPLVDVILVDVTGQSLKTSELIIIDEGTGMDFETVRDNWMTIGTSNKRENPLSKKYGRPVTGNKGIGRFACQRLAERLELSTCAQVNGNYENTTVHFEWDDFSPGQSLANVKCKYESFTTLTGQEGTTLKLKGLREHITERDFKMILKSVNLISIAEPARRKGYPEDPGFEATVTAQEFKYLTGEAKFKIDKTLLSAGWGTLTGSIDENGAVSFTLDSKGTTTQTYSASSTKYPALSGITFNIYIIPLKSRDNLESHREPTLLTGGTVKDIHNLYSGIKVYLNGFRVYPYGEVSEGDDWLRISHDISRRRGPSDYPELSDVAKQMGIGSPTRAMLNHPGTRSLIGNVVIQGEAVNAFEVKMDREGIVASDNFSNLKDIIRMSLDWATINYEAWLIRERKKKHNAVAIRFEKSVGSSFEDDKSRFTKAIETLTSVVDEVESKDILTPEPNLKPDLKNLTLSPLIPKFSEDRHDPASNVQDPENTTVPTINLSKEQYSTAKAYALSQYEALEAETELLRAVSATAPLLFVFAHEVKGIAQALLGQSAQLKLIANKINDPEIKKELTNMAISADMYKKSFDDLFELFEVFSDSASNTKKKISFSNLFYKVNTGFKFFTKQFKIELTFDEVNPTWKVPKLSPAEAYSVLINLLSNSIKSLIASHSEERRLHVSINRVGSDYTMLVQDNGIGLSKEHWEKVFEARTYDPEGKLYSSISSLLGDEQLSNINKGSGLGLNIVRNILSKHRGKVEFIEPSDGWNAEVKVMIGK